MEEIPFANLEPQHDVLAQHRFESGDAVFDLNEAPGADLGRIHPKSLPTPVTMPTSSIEDDDDSLILTGEQGNRPTDSNLASSYVPATLPNAASTLSSALNWVSSRIPIPSSSSTTTSQTRATSNRQIPSNIVSGVLETHNPQVEASPLYRRGSAEESVDVLTFLLCGNDAESSTSIVLDTSQQAYKEMSSALEAKTKGDMAAALQGHSRAAQLFHQAAVLCREQKADSMARSFLLLSQTQAKTALILKKVLQVQNQTSGTGVSLSEPYVVNKGVAKTNVSSHKDRLRATVRGALEGKTEADISNSVFLGKAVSKAKSLTTAEQRQSFVTTRKNPVDDMLELERELKNMDMQLELGNSIASLDARSAQTRALKGSMVDGSFMVVPSQQSPSYMVSSALLVGTSNNTGTSAHVTSGTTPHRQSKPGVSGRTRDRVSTILDASTHRLHPIPPPPHSATTITPAVPPHTSHPQLYPPKPTSQRGLESSWWGAPSTMGVVPGGASQLLTSSVISLASGVHPQGEDMGGGGYSTAVNTKQIMRLMDSLKVLGDENAALLRQVEDLEAARREVKAGREQIRRFKAEYEERFQKLREALEKYRKSENTEFSGSMEERKQQHPVVDSSYMQNVTKSAEIIERQNQQIHALTVDLENMREDLKKKDALLRRYEDFYREVKARSALKAAQKEKGASKR